MTAKRRGFSLIEVLCVIALLSVLGFVLATLLTEIFQVERLQAQGFDKIVQANALADQFRADVADAPSAPQEWQHFKADAETLILQRKNGDHVVYRWEAGELKRVTFENKKIVEPTDAEAVIVGIAAVRARDDREVTERSLPLGKHIGVEFTRDGNPAIVRLRLLTLRAGKAVPGQSLEIAAALGGDWR